MEPAKTDTSGSLRAHDIMTARVITVGPDEPTHNLARLLLEHGISAVPVVNSEGMPIGIVSEGDLIGRTEIERLSRHDWWLAIMSGAQPLDDDFATRVGIADRSARDVMSAPLVTVTEQSDVADIARLLAILRIPVDRDH